MDIQFTKTFTKSYQKLSQKDQRRVKETLDLFIDDPFHNKLHNHTLKGRLAGQRAISAGFDLRILYKEEGNHATVYILKTGTHNQVY